MEDIRIVVGCTDGAAVNGFEALCSGLPNYFYHKNHTATKLPIKNQTKKSVIFLKNEIFVYMYKNLSLINA